MRMENRRQKTENSLEAVQAAKATLDGIMAGNGGEMTPGSWSYRMYHALFEVKLAESWLKRALEEAEEEEKTSTPPSPPGDEELEDGSEYWQAWFETGENPRKGA